MGWLGIGRLQNVCNRRAARHLGFDPVDGTPSWGGSCVVLGVGESELPEAVSGDAGCDADRVRRAGTRSWLHQAGRGSCQGVQSGQLRTCQVAATFGREFHGVWPGVAIS